MQKNALQQGQATISVEMAVDDYVYCKQDEYHLPHTVIDEEGNTSISVVDKVSTDIGSDGFLRARMEIKVFLNERVLVSATPLSSDSSLYQNQFLNASKSYLDYRLKNNSITTYEEKTRSVINYCLSSSQNLNLSYDAYADYSTNASSCTVTLDPYRYNETSQYYRWSNEIRKSILNQHLNYWRGGGVDQSLNRDKERMLLIIRDRMAPAAIVKNKHIARTSDIREIRARQTLKRIIGEDAYQRYLAKGFIVFRGHSGKVYQIYPGHVKTKVWLNKEMVEELCVIMTGNFPPTDQVIMRLLLIQDNEEKFKNMANIFKPNTKYLATEKTAPKQMALPEIFKSIKQNRSIIIAA